MIEMTEDEMRKQIRRVLRQVGRNAREIEAAASVSFDIPTYAVEHLKDFRKQIKKTSIKSATGRTLRNYYRDINYIAGLKSSTIQGAVEMSYSIEPITKAVKQLPKEEQKSFWRVFDKAYSENSLLGRLKYEILDTVYNAMVEGRAPNTEEAAEERGTMIVNMYKELQVDMRRFLHREPTEQELADEFLGRLQYLF